MKTIVVAVLLNASAVCLAHAEANLPPPSSSETLSDRDRIRMDRAKDAAVIKDAGSARPWDKDTQGKRPWDKLPPEAPR